MEDIRHVILEEDSSGQGNQHYDQGRKCAGTVEPMTRGHQGLPKRNLKGFSISRSPKLKFKGNNFRRPKGPDFQGRPRDEPIINEAQRVERSEAKVGGQAIAFTGRHGPSSSNLVTVKPQGPAGWQDGDDAGRSAPGLSQVVTGNPQDPAAAAIPSVDDRTRPRRLILEEESEDEELCLFASLEKTVSPVARSLADGELRPAGKTVQAMEKNQPNRQSKRRLIKAPSRRRLQEEDAAEKKQKQKMEDTKEKRTPKKKPSLAIIDNGTWVEVPVLAAADVSSPVNDRIVLGESLKKAAGEPSSEEEDNNFEIKSRRPMAKAGHVQQVVRAFEAGLNFENSPSPRLQSEKLSALGGEHIVQQATIPNEEIGELNEYGSNYEILQNSERKRSFQKVEGEDIDLPTPKRQFVEERDTAETVEETSLKWSQQNK
ncbi:unnamed protein product [Linum trigynum]|uniref:Uncharacterized protein n=1 Tax=Linum trigynum TaxID=586398 RepID=A0AAV2DBV0_9ROSI